MANMLRDIGMLLRFARRLPDALRPVPLSYHEELLRTGIASRESNFLTLLEQGVFAHKRGAYFRLLEWAGIELGDIRQLVSDEGLEGALDRLFQEGVSVSLDELKGKTPIVRGSFTYTATPRDFENRLAPGDFTALTGGSRSGSGKPVPLNLRELEWDAASCRISASTELETRKCGLWRLAPPGIAGLSNLLILSRIGAETLFWYTQSSPRLGVQPIQSHLFQQYALAASRWNGRPIPRPIQAPLSEAARVARHIGSLVAEGEKLYVDTNVSSGVRLCRAALDEGIDISGTFFRLGSEPLTPGRYRLFEKAGCPLVCHYATVEAGFIGVGCRRPRVADEVHINTARLCLRQHPKVFPGGTTIQPFYLTTLSPTCQILMINLETGDYGIPSAGSCGCRVERAGLEQRVHTIRSYEKLSTEGMHFTGAHLLELLEEVLPTRFGGAATDYQLVEQEKEGLARLSLIVSTRLGDIDTQAAKQTVLEFLGGTNRGDKMMSEILAQADTLRVVRAEPHMTPSSKVLALHVDRHSDPESQHGAPKA